MDGTLSQPMISGATGDSIARWIYSAKAFGIDSWEHCIELTTNELLITKSNKMSQMIPRFVLGCGIGALVSYYGHLLWYWYALTVFLFGVAFSLKVIRRKQESTTSILLTRLNGISTEGTNRRIFLPRILGLVIGFWILPRDPHPYWSAAGVCIGIIGAVLLSALIGIAIILRGRKYDTVHFAVAGAHSQDTSACVEPHMINDIRAKIMQSITMGQPLVDAV